MNPARARIRGRTSSPLSITLLTIMWVLLWGEFTWGNFAAGFLLSVGVSWFLPVPRGPRRRLTIRPIAFTRLAVLFCYDVVVAAIHISVVILTRRTPREAIIRVQTRAHSDGFLTTTAGFTALVPGSIVIDAHRLTGIMYVHIFDVGEGQAGLDEAHQQVLIQEERILRALATNEELMDAGFRPGGSMRAGRLSEAEMAEHRARVRAGQQEAGS